MHELHRIFHSNVWCCQIECITCKTPRFLLELVPVNVVPLCCSCQARLESRLNTPHCPGVLERSQRNLFAYSLAVACRGPVNHQLRNTLVRGGVHLFLPWPDPLAPLGHLAAVHRRTRSCVQEHQDDCRVSGRWADQCSQGERQTPQVFLLRPPPQLNVLAFYCRVHPTLTPSRRRTSWRELPSPTVKLVCFLTNKFGQFPWMWSVLFWRITLEYLSSTTQEQV